MVVVRSSDWGVSPVDSIDWTVADFADLQRMQRQPIDQPRSVPCGGASGMHRLIGGHRMSPELWLGMVDRQSQQ